MKYKFKLKHLVLAVLVVKAVLYGGAKPAGTNAPPDDASSPTNAPMMMCAGPLRGRGLSQTSEVGQTNAASGGLGKTPLLGHRYATLLRSGGYATPVMSNLPPSEPTVNYQLIPNWTARGAYCDWKRIDFCDGFRFPIGTNFIDGVTLFAYGEVKVEGVGVQRRSGILSASEQEPNLLGLGRDLSNRILVDYPTVHWA